MWESSWRIGCSNKYKFSLGCRVLQFDKSVSKWIEAISHSIINIAIYVCVSHEFMYDFGWTHQITI